VCIQQSHTSLTWLWAYKLHSTASPFWRTASANSQRDNNKPATPERKVIGASYSHADILKFDNLYVTQGRESVA
jgi:hypothetical protein